MIMIMNNSNTTKTNNNINNAGRGLPCDMDQKCVGIETDKRSERAM